MKEQLEIIRKTRESFVLMCQNLSIELMNKIPEGYNNNLIWNFGHIIAVQQGLCYGLAGLPMNIERVNLCGVHALLGCAVSGRLPGQLLLQNRRRRRVA